MSSSDHENNDSVVSPKIAAMVNSEIEEEEKLGIRQEIDKDITTEEWTEETERRGGEDAKKN